MDIDTHSFKKLRSTLMKQWKALIQMMILNVPKINISEKGSSTCKKYY